MANTIDDFFLCTLFFLRTLSLQSAAKLTFHAGDLLDKRLGPLVVLLAFEERSREERMCDPGRRLVVSVEIAQHVLQGRRLGRQRKQPAPERRRDQGADELDPRCREQTVG